MFKILGAKIIIFLVILVALNAAVVSAYIYWLTPYEEQLAMQLNTTRGEVEAKRQDVARMKEEFVLLQSQLKTFKQIELSGFFNDQERSAATEKMEKLSNYAGLLKAEIKFGIGDEVEDPLVANSGSVIVKSPVTVTMESLDDVDVYTFVKYLGEKFPGRVGIKSFKLERTEILNAAMFRKIGGGDPTALAKSEVAFDWLTMTPKEAVVPAQMGN